MADAKEEALVKKVYDWALEQLSKEKERLKTLGVEPIELEVIDMSVLMEGKKKQLNRVIFNSTVDFRKVTNMFISKIIKCYFIFQSSN